MPFSWFAKRGLVAALLVLASCSSGAENNGQVAAEATTTSTTPTSTSTAESTTASSTSELAVDESPADEVEASTTPAAPVRASSGVAPDTTEYVDTSVWVSRVKMTSSSIEMTWGDFDGAVEYRLHRVPRTSDPEPDPSEMTDENEIYVATEAGRTIDETVDADTEYWYGIRALTDTGVMVAHGWHPVAAVDDEEPPAQVAVQSAEIVDGEVIVTWAEPSENYELHAYRILRGVDGGELEAIGTTWNTDQRSLIDDNPPSGTLTYAVEAMDFHWNRSTPGTIQVDVP